MLLSPVSDNDSGPVITADAGSSLPAFSLGAMDACGNRTAPPHNEAWQVGEEAFFRGTGVIVTVVMVTVS